MKKLRICFLWLWPRASEIIENWRDGHRAAIEEVGKKHEVVWFLDGKVPDPSDKFDFMLLWGDSTLPFFNEIDKYSCRKGIILTTNPRNFDNLRKLDVVFVESQPVFDEVRRAGIRTILAMGTDTDFYSPDDRVEKDIEYFYPATFSPWKRQSDIAHLGPDLLCVGTVQPDGLDELEACQTFGVKVEEGYFPAEKIRDYYRRTKNIVIPAIHGSERTVLEAMACNILPEVTCPENIRTRSYVEEYKTSGFKTPREFILSKYSHRHYAETLLKGIEQ